MQRIHRPRALLAIEQHQILDRLFATSQHVDNVLCELAAQEGRDRRNLAPRILQETAQEVGCERLGRQSQFLVLFLCHDREQLHAFWRSRGVQRVAVALVLPQRAHACEQRMHLLQTALVTSNLRRKRRVLDEQKRTKQLLFRHHLNRFAVLALCLDVRDAARRALGPRLRRAVAALPLDDKAVRNQVREDVAVHAVRGAGVEGLLVDARARVERGEGHEVEVRGDNDVVCGVEVGVKLVAHIAGDDVDFDAGVEFLDLGGCGFGALGALAGVVKMGKRIVRSCRHRRR
jgi:hypothetical protein